MSNLPQFDQMTPQDQKAWWKQQARRLCDRWGLVGATISWLTFTHNAVFTVRHANTQYVLRVYDATNAAIPRAEAAILSALARHLCVPVPVHNMQLDTVAGVLLEYIGGETLTPSALQPAHCRQIGTYLAQLHALGFDQQAAIVAQRPALDYEGLLGEQGVYALDDAARAVFTDSQHEIMARAEDNIRDVLQTLDAEPTDEMSLIHGDLLLFNIIFQRDDSVCALDWEYSAWGYKLYDLTPLLWQVRSQPNYDDLEDALWQGYTDDHPRPASHRDYLQTLIVARHIASMRWVVQNRHNPDYRARVSDILEQRTAELQHFLDTGTFRRA